MQKVVFVRAHGKPVYKEKKVEVPTGETKKDWLGKEVVLTRTETRTELAGESDCKIDGERLANDINETIASLAEDGYSILSIQEVTSGSYAYKYQSMELTSQKRLVGGTEAVSGEGGFGYGYGFGYTSGILLLAEKKQD